MLVTLVSCRLPQSDALLLPVGTKPKHTSIGAVETAIPPRNESTPAFETSGHVAILSGNGPERVWIPAQLVYQDELFEIWLQEELYLGDELLEHITTAFRTESLPILKSIFPEQAATLGHGNRVQIAIARLGTGGGYFSMRSTPNPPPTAQNIPIILDYAAMPGTPFFDSLLAHETGHYLEWMADEDEDTWVKEGLSMLIEDLRGNISTQWLGNVTTRTLGTQLTAWSSIDPSPHYAISLDFMRFIYNQYGIQAIQHIAESSENGMEGIVAGLSQTGIEISSEALIANWTLANATSLIAESGIDSLKIGEIALEPLTAESISLTLETPQYATQYYLLNLQKPVTITLQSELMTPLLPDPPREQSVWWSGHGDRQVTWLTADLDLSGIDTAQLAFDLWYELEQAWDWAYIQISQEGSNHWEPLNTSNMRSESYETGWPGYTGASGADGEWVRETINLDAFCGQKITLRIQCQTDDAVHLGGIAIGHTELITANPSLTSSTQDIEWTSEGFQQVRPKVEQKYILQIVYPQTDLNLRTIFEGKQQLALTPEQGESAILAISPIAEWTTYPAQYSLELEYLD